MRGRVAAAIEGVAVGLPAPKLTFGKDRSR